ncbi:MAG TPA: hypothetical protein VGK20_13325 [Candidatus Binatia bacterium]|jgi:hypothetical protein
MFGLGFLCGAAAATAFVLYGNGELLIELAERARKASARWHSHDWGNP